MKGSCLPFIITDCKDIIDVSVYTYMYFIYLDKQDYTSLHFLPEHFLYLKTSVKIFQSLPYQV